MPSHLRNRLKALGVASAPARPMRPAGVEVYSRRYDMPGSLRALPSAALRRIGWTGNAFDISKCLFLDTETTGLSHGAGTVAFLVGIGWVLPPDELGRSAMLVEQYLMRDYSDEPELLDKLADRMDAFEYVCTFNGRTFDLPLLEARYTLNRMRHRWREMEHLDLLPPSRRTWKLRLGSCKLGRLEEYILGQPRGHDLPGSEVPKRYFEYLKTGNAELLEDIVAHNRQDIATLGLLLDKLCAIHAAPELQKDRRDLFSVGRTLEKHGEFREARELYRVCAVPPPSGTLESLSAQRVAGMANWRSYLLAKKRGDTEEMRGLLECMRRRRQMPYEVLIEQSKLYEHRDRAYDKALDCALKAYGICSDNDRATLEKRITRLKAKQMKTEDRNNGIV